MPRKIVANLHGEQLCFNCVRFVDEDSNCCGCEISVSCSSVGRKLWNALRNVVFLLLLHVTLKYTTEYSLLLYFITFILGTAYLLSAIVFSVYKQSVIVVESLGVQVCTVYWWGYSSSLFLPHTIIGDIIINEAISMHRIIFYLAAMVGEGRGSQCKVFKLVPLFTEFSPGLLTIETIYHEIRNVLYPTSLQK